MLPSVLFVSYTADWTGPTNSLLHLLRHLRTMYSPVVMVPGYGQFSEVLEREGIACITQKANKWTVPALARLIHRKGFRLVYANNTHSSARIAFLAARLAGVPYVCHVRGIKWDADWRRLGYLRWADAVVAVSQSCAASIRRFVREERLHVVYNGVASAEDADRGHSDVAAMRSTLGLPEDTLLLVSIAHFRPAKGQEYAIEAMSEVHTAFPHAHLCLAGRMDRDAAYTERLRALIRDRGLERNVHLLGFRSDVTSLLTAADIFVHPSLEEAHPRAVLEAMSAGLPVVAFAVDGVKETVVDGTTGRLTPVRNAHAMATALIELARDTDARSRMGTAGRDRVTRIFSDRVTAERVGQLISQLI